MTASHRKTALVTGASGGIGLELAKIFARKKYNLVLTARSRDKLEDLAGKLKKDYDADSRVIVKDLAKADSTQELFDEIHKDGIAIEILVNNAGFGKLSSFSRSDLANTLQMIQLNITTLTHLTRLFLPSMLERKSGRILNVASMAAFQPGPYMAIYYASKAYVLSFSEALSEELSGSGVTVTALCPGPTKTGFQARAGIKNSRLIQSLGFMESNMVAEAGYRALMHGKRVAVPGILNKVGVVATSIFPHSITMKIIKREVNGE
jgi:short-subunit dehydrogenase